MSAEAQPEPAPAKPEPAFKHGDKVTVPAVDREEVSLGKERALLSPDKPALPPKPKRTLLPEGYLLTIDGHTFRLEMRTVISGNAQDIAALNLPPLE